MSSTPARERTRLRFYPPEHWVFRKPRASRGEPSGEDGEEDRHRAAAVRDELVRAAGGEENYVLILRLRMGEVTCQEIAEDTGYHRITIWKWWKAAEAKMVAHLTGPAGEPGDVSAR
jgi:hypothetical protein